MAINDLGSGVPRRQEKYKREFLQHNNQLRMEKIIKDYASYLHQLGYAQSSITGRHKRSIKEFIEFVNRNGVQDPDDKYGTGWKSIKSKHIRKYLDYLRGRENKVVGGKLTEKTVYDHFRSIELLYDFMIGNGTVRTNPSSEIEMKAPPRSQRKIIVTETEISLLYKYCKDEKERAILSLNYGCGLRVGELERIEIRDLKLDDGYLIVQRGKGNKRRSVPMSIGVTKDIRSYLKYERPRLTAERHYHKSNQSVILNEVGRPMKEWTFNTILQKIAMRTESPDLINKRITTHMLRHSIASHLLDRGLDIHQVRQFLGHVLLSTTQIYTHINNKQVMQL